MIYDLQVKAIDGSAKELGDYRGKVLLVVNVASKCGLTPQYAGLQSLYADKQAEGLEILGFPSNDFKGQEPGTEDEIKAFCQVKFDVDFPMTAKVDVKDEHRHPFYAWAQDKLGDAAVPVWNFHKILIGADGEALAAFGPRTDPLDASITEAVEKAL